jgi:putative transposon-encoded protein
LVSRRIIECPIVKVGTRSGNGGHVIIPEHWIGKKIRCSIIGEAEGDNSYSNNKTQQHQPRATNKTIEDKFISRVAREVGDNYITRPTRARASSKGK